MHIFPCLARSSCPSTLIALKSLDFSLRRFINFLSFFWCLSIDDGGMAIYTGTCNPSNLEIENCNDDGNIGIGTASPTQNLSVNGTAGKTGGGSWSTFSDRRVKTDIQTYSKGLNEIMEINLDTSSLQALGWFPKTTIKQGLKLTIDKELKQ